MKKNFLKPYINFPNFIQSCISLFILNNKVFIICLGKIIVFVKKNKLLSFIFLICIFILIYIVLIIDNPILNDYIEYKDCESYIQESNKNKDILKQNIYNSYTNIIDPNLYSSYSNTNFTLKYLNLNINNSNTQLLSDREYVKLSYYKELYLVSELRQAKLENYNNLKKMLEIVKSK